MNDMWETTSVRTDVEAIVGRSRYDQSVPNGAIAQQVLDAIAATLGQSDLAPSAPVPVVPDTAPVAPEPAMAVPVDAVSADPTPAEETPAPAPVPNLDTPADVIARDRHNPDITDDQLAQEIAEAEAATNHASL